ncbi:unnamed protein product [Urochloa decumbens]|uniref:Transposase Tnp1/En/Spm-like domain-containing protein n=1 Tax=Urochloa decumbens TaxID=240449 RepID=A0ABC8ZM49_9POAL
MAADIWTLNLQCEGAPHGQQYVQRKMAKDEICFFNLVALIEDYGYTSIDYIYYKSRERLVFIQLDTDVMKMLRDNESKKEVNLLVTSQCIATMAGTSPTKHQPLQRIELKTKFLYPRSCEKWILKSIARDWRKYKSTLKKKLFSPKKKRSALYKLCPDDIDEDQWKALVKYWKSAEGKAASEKNTLSCEMRKTPHTGGTKSFARWSEDMRQADPTKKPPHRAKVYLATHKTRVNGTNQPVVQLENLVEKQPELAENSEGRVAWEGDALHQVLGEEKPGQVHGMGLLPIPKQVYGRTTRQLKDINIATIDGSSADVETHMFEEIQQLKDRVRKQDRVIDELVNKKRDHENEEPNKNHVLQSNRKRIQCPEPNHGDAAYQQRDESNNRTCECDDNDDPVLSNKKCQGDANLKQLSLREGEPSSPQCSTNDFTQKQISNDGTVTRKRKNQQVLQETRTKKKHVAHDNATGYNHSKYTQSHPIKDGTTVLLKTASRQNSLVAYATIVSSRPKATVGGVEIGKQFYKVRINHPILQNEPLIRPMADCSKIGDAHAKGTLIAWPSTCVEMING